MRCAVRLGLGSDLGQTFAKQHMRDFEIAQRIVQIAQIDKSRATLMLSR